MAFDFGILQPLVDDPNITDIDSNGSTIYVSHVENGKYQYECEMEERFIENLVNRLCNAKEINQQINYEHPVLDGEIDGLRIHATSSKFSVSGTTLRIRKNPVSLVITRETAKKTGYCKDIVFDLLETIVKAKMSVLFGGEVGTGKTQLMKTMLSYTPEESGIVFISDIDEMRFLELYPNRNAVQYIVNDIMDYTKSASCVLRDSADYVCFQEVRDSAVDDLFLVLSSSARVTATVHLKNALLMPQRLIQLSESKNDVHLLSTIHDYIQCCIVPEKEILNGKTKRYIGQIALFWNDENGKPKKKLIYERTRDMVRCYALPSYFVDFFEKQGLILDWSESVEKV